MTGNIVNYGTYVSFYFVFYSTTTMLVNTSYLIANISSNCRPYSPRVINFKSNGRDCTYQINVDGSVYFRIETGTNINSGTVVGNPTSSYYL